MKKLVLILSFFTANLFTNQVESSTNPPKDIVIDSQFVCTQGSWDPSNRMAILTYHVFGILNKISPQKDPDSHAAIIIILTFVPDLDLSTVVHCHAIDTIIRSNATTTGFSTNLLLSRKTFILNLPKMPFQQYEFTNPETIKALIKLSLSAYFRKYYLDKRVCVFCSKTITMQDPAVLLNCANGAHETCYNANRLQKCPACGEDISKDIWYNLEALPAGIE